MGGVTVHGNHSGRRSGRGTRGMGCGVGVVGGETRPSDTKSNVKDLNTNLP